MREKNLTPSLATQRAFVLQRSSVLPAEVAVFHEIWLLNNDLYPSTPVCKVLSLTYIWLECYNLTIDFFRIKLLSYGEKAAIVVNYCHLVVSSLKYNQFNMHLTTLPVCNHRTCVFAIISVSYVLYMSVL